MKKLKAKRINGAYYIERIKQTLADSPELKPWCRAVIRVTLWYKNAIKYIEAMIKEREENEV